MAIFPFTEENSGIFQAHKQKRKFNTQEKSLKIKRPVFRPVVRGKFLLMDLLLIHSHVINFECGTFKCWIDCTS
jgi:hypothetical protein